MADSDITTTTQPVTTQPVYIRTSTRYPEITTIKEALKENDKNLQSARYDIINNSDEINTLTNRLNNLLFNINSLKKKPNYSASGELTFY